MPFIPQRGSFYRMPVFFGPTPGPRQWPEGRSFDFTKLPKRRVVGSRFLSDAAQLSVLLPDRFEVWGEPVVTVEATYMTEIGWLAGRGYNMCDVKFNAAYMGKDGPVHGTLVLVRFENLADPILSGREELGHNKLYCEIPELLSLDGRYSTTLGWLGHPFLELEVANLSDATQPAPSDPPNQGMLSYKYIPATGDWGVADVEYATLSPPSPNIRTTLRQAGEGTVRVLPCTWEQLPTLYHLVNAFASLEVREARGGYLLEQQGGSSVAETVRLA